VIGLLLETSWLIFAMDASHQANTDGVLKSDPKNSGIAVSVRDRSVVCDLRAVLKSAGLEMTL
jgi:hypothetical protein